MTQDEIVEMARETGDLVVDARGRMDFSFDEYGLIAFANLVADKEREECAKVCDELSDKHTWEGCYANECAGAIRARGEQA